MYNNKLVMNEENGLCVICTTETNVKVTLFSEKTLKKCSEVLKIRQKHRLKYNNIVIPSKVVASKGYHVQCYKNFIAVMRKYYENSPTMDHDLQPPLTGTVQFCVSYL